MPVLVQFSDWRHTKVARKSGRIGNKLENRVVHAVLA
jgi:hypothetical protein